MKNIEIYTDGSCNNKDGKKVGAWCFVLYENGIKRYYKTGIELEATSQRVEMFAVINAFEWIKQQRMMNCIIDLKTDSAYISNCFIDKWYEKWVDNDFLLVKNSDLWKIMINEYFDLILKNNIKINIIKIPGHSGIEGNEMADKLCGKARVDYLNAPKDIQNKNKCYVK